MSERGQILDGIAALKADLLHGKGPQISTMRNYRFALFLYPPAEEFAVRAHMRRLLDELEGRGWGVCSIDLYQLLLRRIRTLGDEALKMIIERERRFQAKENLKGLDYLRDKVASLIEGPDGIASDVLQLVEEFAAQHPDQADRTLVLIGRAGALYPFFRSSALLRHIDGKTRNMPVVLLYPGTRNESGGLSFMGVLPPDRDYRPRIYP